jgi:hypothetical protein
MWRYSQCGLAERAVEGDILGAVPGGLVSVMPHSFVSVMPMNARVMM